MSLRIPPALLTQIRAHGEACYPEEGAGLVLGRDEGLNRAAEVILLLRNSSEADTRRRRYRIGPAEMLAAEQEAERLGLEVVGVFHSHPDHPALASDYDREWAMPWFSYLITSVRQGQAVESRSWRLSEDRLRMVEEPFQVEAPEVQ
jgi:proteasome lid subunit RPN8/RPN11